MLTGKLIFLSAGAVVITATLSTGCSRSPQAQEANYLKHGKAMLAQKDAGRAQLEFMNAAKVMPKDAEPQYQLGLALLALHNTRSAVSAFQKALALDPKRADAQLMLAELMTATRNPNLIQDAMNRLQSILTASPDNLEAIDTLAINKWEMGKPDDAEKLLEGALEKSPADLRSSIMLSRMKLGQRDFDGAEEVLKKAVASAPRSPQAGLALGMLYVRLNQGEKAERAFRQALQADPKYGPALMGLAAVQTAGNRLEEAERTLRQAATLPEGTYAPMHANFLFQIGKQDLALAEFAKLAKDHSGDRIARARLLGAYLAMNKVAEVQTLLAAALKKNPKDVDALYQRSKLYVKSGKSAEALQDLDQVRHFAPKAVPVHRMLAAIYKAQHSPRMERNELGEVLQLDRAHLPSRLDLADNLLAGGNGAQALRLLDEAPGAQKKVLRLIIVRNRALMALGKAQELRTVLDQTLAQERVPELVLQDALLKQASGDYAGARASAEEVLKQNAEDPTAVLLVADSYLAQKQPDRALARLSQMVAALPNSAQLRFVLGEFYARAGTSTEARKTLESAKIANPKFFQADFALADLDCREKQPERARQRLRTVLAADRNNVAALMKLATIEEEAGNAVEAMAAYRATLNADGSNVTAMNNLAYHLAMENPDEALKLAQQAAEAAPESPDVQDTLGWVYYRKGIYNTATGYLKAAFTKSPTAQRQFHLAMSYLKQGEKTLGQQMLLTALQKDPNLANTEHGW